MDHRIALALGCVCVAHSVYCFYRMSRVAEELVHAITQITELHMLAGDEEDTDTDDDDTDDETADTDTDDRLDELFMTLAAAINDRRAPHNRLAAERLCDLSFFACDGAVSCRFCGAGVLGLATGSVDEPAHIACHAAVLQRANPQFAPFFSLLGAHVSMVAAPAADFHCAVCLDGPDSANPVVKLSGCTHHFHAKCLITALSTSFRCPICRNNPS
jgi:hypothetical protein